MSYRELNAMTSRRRRYYRQYQQQAEQSNVQLNPGTSAFSKTLLQPMPLNSYPVQPNV